MTPSKHLQLSTVSRAEVMTTVTAQTSRDYFNALADRRVHTINLAANMSATGSMLPVPGNSLPAGDAAHTAEINAAVAARNAGGALESFPRARPVLIRSEPGQPRRSLNIHAASRLDMTDSVTITFENVDITLGSGGTQSDRDVGVFHSSDPVPAAFADAHAVVPIRQVRFGAGVVVTWTGGELSRPRRAPRNSSTFVASSTTPLSVVLGTVRGASPAPQIRMSGPNTMPFPTFFGDNWDGAVFVGAASFAPPRPIVTANITNNHNLAVVRMFGGTFRACTFSLEVADTRLWEIIRIEDEWTDGTSVTPNQLTLVPGAGPNGHNRILAIKPNANVLAAARANISALPANVNSAVIAAAAALEWEVPAGATALQRAEHAYTLVAGEISATAAVLDAKPVVDGNRRPDQRTPMPEGAALTAAWAAYLAGVVRGTAFHAIGIYSGAFTAANPPAGGGAVNWEPRLAALDIADFDLLTQSNYYRGTNVFWLEAESLNDTIPFGASGVSSHAADPNPHVGKHYLALNVHNWAGSRDTEGAAADFGKYFRRKFRKAGKWYLATASNDTLDPFTKYPVAVLAGLLASNDEKTVDIALNVLSSVQAAIATDDGPPIQHKVADPTVARVPETTMIPPAEANLLANINARDYGQIGTTNNTVGSYSALFRGQDNGVASYTLTFENFPSTKPFSDTGICDVEIRMGGPTETYPSDTYLAPVSILYQTSPQAGTFVTEYNVAALGETATTDFDLNLRSATVVQMAVTSNNGGLAGASRLSVARLLAPNENAGNLNMSMAPGESEEFLRILQFSADNAAWLDVHTNSTTAGFLTVPAGTSNATPFNFFVRINPDAANHITAGGGDGGARVAELATALKTLTLFWSLSINGNEIFINDTPMVGSKPRRAVFRLTNLPDPFILVAKNPGAFQTGAGELTTSVFGDSLPAGTFTLPEPKLDISTGVLTYDLPVQIKAGKFETGEQIVTINLLSSGNPTIDGVRYPTSDGITLKVYTDAAKTVSTGITFVDAQNSSFSLGDTLNSQTRPKDAADLADRTPLLLWLEITAAAGTQTREFQTFPLSVRFTPGIPITAGDNTGTGATRFHAGFTNDHALWARTLVPLEREGVQVGTTPSSWHKGVGAAVTGKEGAALEYEVALPYKTPANVVGTPSGVPFSFTQKAPSLPGISLPADVTLGGDSVLKALKSTVAINMEVKGVRSATIVASATRPRYTVFNTGATAGKALPDTPVVSTVEVVLTVAESNTRGWVMSVPFMQTQQATMTAGYGQLVKNVLPVPVVTKLPAAVVTPMQGQVNPNDFKAGRLQVQNKSAPIEMRFVLTSQPIAGQTATFVIGTGALSRTGVNGVKSDGNGNFTPEPDTIKTEAEAVDNPQYFDPGVKTKASGVTFGTTLTTTPPGSTTVSLTFDATNWNTPRSFWFYPHNSDLGRADVVEGGPPVVVHTGWANNAARGVEITVTKQQRQGAGLWGADDVNDYDSVQPIAVDALNVFIEEAETQMRVTDRHITFGNWRIGASTNGDSLQFLKQQINTPQSAWLTFGTISTTCGWQYWGSAGHVSGITEGTFTGVPITQVCVAGSVLVASVPSGAGLPRQQ
jgi:hypothetical protein